MQKTSHCNQCKMGEIQPFTCKAKKKSLVGLQVSNSSFKFDIICTGAAILQCGIGKKMLQCKTGEIQPCRWYAVQVFVGLQVSNSSVPRFHIRGITCTGLTVLQCGISCMQWVK